LEGTIPTAGAATLGQLLRPGSIAVVGASEDQTKFGGRLLRMLLRHDFPGEVFPVNPSRDTLFGLKSYPGLESLPRVPDMVVLTIPQPAIKAQIEVAARMGVGCGVIITSGFSDADEAGRKLENEIVAIARAGGMRLVGPNCLGIISAANKLVLCSSPVLEIESLPQQAIGLVSQSGALMTCFFDRAWSQGIGFSHGFSVGNQADLDLCDFVEFLVDDLDTKVICTYIEGVKHPARLIEVARRARLAGKPWLAVKAGRTDAGGRATFSHTASIAGDYATFAAVCRDAGITLMDDIGAMTTLAALMVRYGDRRIERLALLTPSGGGGALTSDALAEHGVSLAEFSAGTQAALAEHFPKGQANNPVDFGGRKTADPALVARAVMKAFDEDPQTDGIQIPVAMAPHMWLREFALAQPERGRQPAGKPVLFTLEAGHASEALRAMLRERGLPYTNTTGEAVDVWSAWRRRGLTVLPREAARPADLPPPAQAPGAGEYDEQRSKALFSRYGIPVNAGEVAADADEAVAIADRLGYPVVMKIVSPDIVHKTEAQAVAVNVADAGAVRAAFAGIRGNALKAVPGARIQGVAVQAMIRGELELIVGARRDAQYGPIVVFGAGGILVEILGAMAIARAPVHPDHIRNLLATLPIWPVLKGYRGRALALDAVVDAIHRVSWLACDLGDRDFELDINPLIVGREACRAVDGRLRIA